MERRPARDGEDARPRIDATMALTADAARDHPRLPARLDRPAAPDYARAPERTLGLGLSALPDGLANRLPGCPAAARPCGGAV
ncbi:hypothetical protein ACFV4P_30705 [Kitasatospora sp. NPDC059795]|uniref:hypothetical protein n=1 Tax=Kitasatospora sp. NPDC059795 TaxID=3346949 RepID=UPI00364B1450